MSKRTLILSWMNTINGLFCRWYLVHAISHNGNTCFLSLSQSLCYTKHNYSIYAEINLQKRMQTFPLAKTLRFSLQSIQMQCVFMSIWTNAVEAFYFWCWHRQFLDMNFIQFTVSWSIYKRLQHLPKQSEKSITPNSKQVPKCFCFFVCMQINCIYLFLICLNFSLFFSV